MSERHTRPFYKLSARRSTPLHASTRRINKTHTASRMLGIDQSMHHDVVQRSLRHKHSSPPVHAQGGSSQSNIKSHKDPKLHLMYHGTHRDDHTNIRHDPQNSTSSNSIRLSTNVSQTSHLPRDGHGNIPAVVRRAPLPNSEKATSGQRSTTTPRALACSSRVLIIES